MKKMRFFLLLVIYLSQFGCASQSKIKKVLSLSQKNCQKIEWGNYNLQFSKKWHHDNDTLIKNYRVSFEKETDTSFWAVVKHHDNDTLLAYYTPDSFYQFSYIENRYLRAKLDSKDINERIYHFFLPNNYSHLLDYEKGLWADTTSNIEYLGVKSIKGKRVHKVRLKLNVNDKPALDEVSFTIFIERETYIPIRLSIDIVLMGKRQYQDWEIIESNLNHPNEKNYCSNFIIPKRFKLYKSNFEERITKGLLEKDVLAPLFTLPNLENDSIHLNQINDGLILLDFWYLSCYPCRKAIPELNRLDSLYQKKGLTILGINSYDGKKLEKVRETVQELKISYPILMDNAKEVNKKYRITSYPSYYLLDAKSKKIIHQDSGYKPFRGNKSELELIIKNNLDSL